jgi:protein-disulfide isomerase-like protein with CxxC motif
MSVVKYLGVKLESEEAELAKTAMKLIYDGQTTSATLIIRKMGSLGYTKALEAIHEKLLKDGKTAAANEVMEQIGPE